MHSIAIININRKCCILAKINLKVTGIRASDSYPCFYELVLATLPANLKSNNESRDKVKGASDK